MYQRLLLPMTLDALTSILYCYLKQIDALRASRNLLSMGLVGSWSNLGPHLWIPVIQFNVNNRKDHNLDQSNFVVKPLVKRRLEVIPDVKLQSTKSVYLLRPSTLSGIGAQS